MNGFQRDDERQSIISDSSGDRKTPVTRLLICTTLLSAVGGFLFGYDTGVISGAMLQLRTHFKLSHLWQELVVSVTIAGAWAFAIFAGVATDAFGRKPVILVASFVFTIGAVLMGVAVNTGMLLGGRLIVGAGIGELARLLSLESAACLHLRAAFSSMADKASIPLGLCEKLARV